MRSQYMAKWGPMRAVESAWARMASYEDERTGGGRVTVQPTLTVPGPGCVSQATTTVHLPLLPPPPPTDQSCSHGYSYLGNLVFLCGNLAYFYERRDIIVWMCVSSGFRLQVTSQHTHAHYRPQGAFIKSWEKFKVQFCLLGGKNKLSEKIYNRAMPVATSRQTLNRLSLLLMSR